jgi:hypothetical protein
MPFDWFRTWQLRPASASEKLRLPPIRHGAATALQELKELKEQNTETDLMEANASKASRRLQPEHSECCLMSQQIQLEDSWKGPARSD